MPRLIAFKPLTGLLFAAFFALMSAACGGGGGKSSGSQSTLFTDTFSSGDNATQMVSILADSGAIEGAGIELSAGTIPNGENWTLALGNGTASEVTDFSVAGPVVKMEITRAGGAPAQLDQPATITLPYDTPLPAGSSLDDLRVFRRSAPGSTPLIVPDAVADTINGISVLVVETSSFSDFWVGLFVAPTGSPVTIDTASTLPNASLGATYNESIASTGGSTGQAWEVSAGILPFGMGFSSLGASATISGTPTLEGSYEFVVTTTQGSLRTSKFFRIDVVVDTLVISPATLAEGTTGQAYSTNINATGGTNAGYMWIVEAGKLPTGLSISDGTPAAAISGTPTTAGTFNFTLRVTDSGSNVASRPFSVTIDEALAITTTSIPSGTEGVAYTSNALSATGGVAPYSWSVASSGDSLPAGLSIDAATGEISGTPQAGSAGTYNLDIEVSDSDSPANTDTQTITLNLTAPGTPGQIIDLAAAYAAQANKLTLNWTATGSDGNTGTADEYELRTSTSLITSGNFSSAGLIVTSAPQSSGSSETITFDLSWYSGTHYFAIIAKNTSPAASGPLSNVLQVDMDLNTSFPGTSHAFGTVTSPPATQNFSVTNNASFVDLEIAGASLSGDSEFSITAGSGSATLAPGDSGTITVSFTPSGAGPFNSTLNIDHNDAGATDPFAITLSGSGVGAAPFIVRSVASPSIIEVESSFDLEIDVSDTNSSLPVTNDISSVTVDLSAFGGSATQALSFQSTQSINTGRYTATISTDNVPAAEYVLTVTATDSAGSVAQADVALAVVSPLQHPEVLFEYPPAADNATTTIPVNSKFVVIFSKEMDTSSSSFDYSFSGTFLHTVNGIAGSGSFAFATGIEDMDNRIVVIDPTNNLGSVNDTILLGLFGARVSGGVMGNGIRDTQGNRLNTGHTSTNIVSIGGDPAVGIQWKAAASDSTAPTVSAREPVANSSNSGPGAFIRIEFDEAIDPSTLSNFDLRDSSNIQVSGALSIDPSTLQTLTFVPDATLGPGSHNVTLAGIADLCGNALTSGSNYSFTVGADAAPPVIELLTLNGLPDYLNGSSANGGNSPGGGKVLTHPTGFTIDLEYRDVGGSGVSTTPTDFSIIANRTVGSVSAGNNLAGSFGASNVSIGAKSACFLVPAGLSFPTGDTEITVSIRDTEGNTSTSKSFTFAVTNSGTMPFNPSLGPDEWKLYFERDFETITINTAASSITVPGNANSASSPDGKIDWLQDLEAMGFINPANSAETVNGSSLTLNDAARNFVTNRILFHMYRYFGVSVDIADGNNNPGFAAIIDNPTVSTTSASTNIRFAVVTSNPGSGFSRMAFGGYHDSTTLGQATVNSNNTNRNEDNGVTSGRFDTGTFSTFQAYDYWSGTPVAGGQFYYYWDATSPMADADQGEVIGESSHDNFILDPAQDPSTFTGARLTRYQTVVRAFDAYAQALASTAAHEVGHSVGLVENGELGTGLYGNQTAAFPGSTSNHVQLETYYAGSGQNLMAAKGGISYALSRFSTFNELVHAYMQNLCVVP